MLRGRKFVVILISLAMVLTTFTAYIPITRALMPVGDIHNNGSTNAKYTPLLKVGHPYLVYRDYLIKAERAGDIADAYFVTFDGPVTDGQRLALESHVLKVVGYIQQFSFLVIAKPSQLIDVLDNVPHVQSVYWYPYDARVAPNMEYAKDGYVAKVFENGRVIYRNLSTLPWLQSKDGLTVESYMEDSVRKGKIILWVEPKPHFELYNDKAAVVTNVKPVAWETYGYNGSGQITAVADTGLDTGATSTMVPDLKNRLVALLNHAGGGWNSPGDPNDEHGHGTHVSGSVVGDGTESGGAVKGMAPGAGLVFQAIMDSNGGLSGIPDDLGILFDEAYQHGARIHSDSWGVPLNSGGHVYDDFTASGDNYLWQNPYMTVLFAAGNDGDNQAQHSVTAPGTAKNVITVGASENDRPNEGSNSDNPDDIAWFSSRGPAPDGRVKPDVVAPGTWILSVKSADAPSSNFWGDCDYSESWCSHYAYMGGTSMATPITNGFTTVVRGYLVDKGFANPTSSLLKAVLIAGAKPLGDGYPNKDFGWGRIDMSGIIPEYESGHLKLFDESQTASLSTGQEWTTTFNVADYQQDLRVVLVWRDYPGQPQAQKELVNDLDLEIVDPFGNVIKPVTVNNPDCGDGNRDNTNNVEVVRILNPAIGTYTVKVKAYNIPYGPQPFSLAIRGSLGNGSVAETNPPSVSVSGIQDGQTVSGIVTIDASASDDTGVYYISLYVDGQKVADNLADNLHYQLNTTQYSNGSHTINVKAYDYYGNEGEENINVVVNNGHGNLQVHVVKEDGTAVAGASVRAENITLGNIYTASTDASGDITFNDVPEGQYRIKAWISGFAGMNTAVVVADQTTSVEIILHRKWLIVNDSKDTDDFLSYYTSALEANNISYDVYNNNYQNPVPDSVDFSEYYAVIWYTGHDYSHTFLPQDRQKIADYLNSGGRVWITSGDALYDTYNDEPNFWRTYFGVKYVSDVSSGTYDIQGATGSPFEDLSFSIDSYWPENVQTDGDGQLAFINTTKSQNIGTYVVGGWRSLYTGFGLYEITSTDARNDLVAKVEQFFSGTVIYAPVLEQPSSTLTYNPEMTVEGSASPGLTVKVYDNSTLVGQAVADSNGQFSVGITLTDGKNVIKARACDGDVCSGWSNAIQVTYIAGSGPGNLEGIVTKDGQPVAGAQVMLRSATYGLAYATQTDSSGHYQFNNIPGITYDASARSSNPTGFWSGQITVQPSQTTTYNIQLGNGKPWTVILYINADNNLSSYGAEDLNEMENGINTEDVNVIALLDQGSNGDSRVYEIHHDTDMNNINSPQITVPGLGSEVNMGDPNTLSIFIEYVVTHYPAQHYALFVWDHGSGWVESYSTAGDKFSPMGVSYDDTDGDHLTMLEVKQAFADVYAATGVKLDVFDYDACLMANVEVAYETKDYVHYVVASEQTEPGDGDDYVAIGQALTDDPNITPLDLANVIAHSFVYQYSNDVTKSVIDGTQLDSLINALSVFAGYLAEAKENGEDVSSWISSAHSFYNSYYKDLYDIALKVKQGTSDPKLQAAAQKVMDLVDGTQDGVGAVVKFYELGHDAAKGLSIEYHGQYGNDDFYKSLDSSLKSLWDEFLVVYDGGSLARVDVKVVDTSSTPIAGAQVSISGPSAGFTAETGNDGIAGIFYLRNGNFTIHVSAQGYQDKEVSVDTSGGDAHIVVKLHPANTSQLTVAFNSPSNGDTLAGSATISVTSQTTNGRVIYTKIFINNELYSVCNGNGTAQLDCTIGWDTTQVPNGQYTIMAKSADSNGNHTTATIAITVNNPLKPIVHILQPADGQTVSGTVDIVVTATDPDGYVAQISIYIDDSIVKTCENADTCSYQWILAKLPPTGHTIKAVAIDNGGNISQMQIEVVEQGGWKKQLVTLHPGWNVITFTIASSDTLSTLLPMAESIMRLEGGTFYAADSEVPVVGKGYLVKVKKPITVELWGSSISDPGQVDVEDGSGWYAIGIPVSNVVAGNVFGITPTGEHIAPDQILALNKGGVFIILNPDDVLEAGRGYFVKFSTTITAIGWTVSP